MQYSPSEASQHYKLPLRTPEYRVCLLFVKRFWKETNSDLNLIESLCLQAVNSIWSSKDISELYKQVLTTALSSALLQAKPSSTKMLKGSKRDQKTPAYNLGINFIWSEPSLYYHLTSVSQSHKIIPPYRPFIPRHWTDSESKQFSCHREVKSLQYNVRQSIYCYSTQNQAQFWLYCIYCHAKCLVTVFFTCFSVTYLWVLFSHCF